jgi:opacity protein-like surface antigen
MCRAMPIRLGIFSLLLGTVPCLFAQSETHHFTANAGGGFTTSTGRLSNDLDYGGNLEVGAGFNFNQFLGVLGTFSFQGLGVTRSALNRLNEPDGNARVYTLTVDPKISFPLGSRVSLYVLGGGGWLRRTVQFTQPVLEPTLIIDPWWGYVGPGFIPANQVLGSVSQNAGVWDIGGGVNIPLPRSGWKLYVQARYYEWANQQHSYDFGSHYGWIALVGCRAATDGSGKNVQAHQLQRRNGRLRLNSNAS